METLSTSQLLWQRIKPALVVVGAVAIALILLVWASRPQASTNGPTGGSGGSGGTLSAAETSYDFGTISMAAGTVHKEFTVRNTTDKPVTISKLYTSCMCTKAEFIKGSDRYGPFGMPGHGFVPRLDQTLGPGEQAIVSAVFDPAAHGPAGVGPIDRVVTLEPTSGSPLELKFTAIVTP